MLRVTTRQPDGEGYVSIITRPSGCQGGHRHAEPSKEVAEGEVQEEGTCVCTRVNTHTKAQSRNKREKDVISATGELCQSNASLNKGNLMNIHLVQTVSSRHIAEHAHLGGRS